MSNCHGGINQNFYYAKDTKRIFVELSRGQGNFCLNNPINNPSVSGWACHNDPHQQWFADDMGRLRTGYDGKCLELNSSNNDIVVAACTDSGQQRFTLPQPLKTNAILQTVSGDPNLCVDYDDVSKNVYMGRCYGGTNQDFYYDGGTRTIRDNKERKCWMAGGDKNVVGTDCGRAEAKKWTVENDGTIRYDGGKACLQRTSGNNVVVSDCTGNEGQLFLVPLSFGNRKNTIKSYFNKDLCKMTCSVLSHRNPGNVGIIH